MVTNSETAVERMHSSSSDEAACRGVSMLRIVRFLSLYCVCVITVAGVSLPSVAGVVQTQTTNRHSVFAIRLCILIMRALVPQVLVPLGGS